ncbi:MULTISPECIES: hypothetical protein [Convivina]|uniref:Uncharacterized protein n=2 Tax=Convivina TaxID=1697027 RepID=A0A2U1DG07_9LACO|nr:MULTISPECIES: hypothetical protein [Convivina]SDC12557.1 hypothetical protein SAMN05216341_1144 [Leuconostocaceae bacterium R-53105]PVY86499.1 hypothetical protein C7384_101419 [Convivina intestini]CAH1853355.1 hypothetical protein R077815_00809 [Convivina sp. LMG 32447]CAH1854724.1 hypothetical protein LMG032447_00923 [Convivina sp. LMG 32447]CAH1857608.1 hypothetical protein R077811_01634 [Convivina intestini]
MDNVITAAIIGIVPAAITAILTYKGKHEDTLTSVLNGIREDNRELKASNEKILEDNKRLSNQVNQLILLVKEMNSELKSYGHDYSERIKSITE